MPGWHALYHEDVTLSETLLEAGYINALISSLYHQFKPGRNFQRGFHTWQWIRGLEYDFYGTSPHHPLDVSDLVSDEYLAKFPGLRDSLSQYKANRNLWQQQGESVSQITAQAAIRWLNQNYAEKPFYLQVEFFDPHEPWDPPRRFLEKYMPNAHGPSFIEPPYDTVPLSDEIKNRMRANYAGEVSCVDHWIGSLLETIEQFGLLENSVVVFMADHGAMLGEHEQFLKGPDKLRGQVTHIPLLIHVPGNPSCRKEGAGICSNSGCHAHGARPFGAQAAFAGNGQRFLAARDGGKRFDPRVRRANLWLGGSGTERGMELQRNLEAGSAREQVSQISRRSRRPLPAAAIQPSKRP